VETTRTYYITDQILIVIVDVDHSIFFIDDVRRETGFILTDELALELLQDIVFEVCSVMSVDDNIAFLI
jgi:hypothetical protein